MTTQSTTVTAGNTSGNVAADPTGNVIVTTPVLPTKDELAASRATIMAALAQQDREEAQVDLDHLQVAQAALADPAIDTLLQTLTAAAAALTNPNRATQVTNVVQVINAVRATLVNYVAEAKQLATPPTPTVSGNVAVSTGQ